MPITYRVDGIHMFTSFDRVEEARDWLGLPTTE